MKKGIVYYTNNRCNPEILKAVRDQLKLCANGYQLISVSQEPLNYGKNICVNTKSSIETMFRQILIGLEALDSEIAFLCEHDVLYHPGHFDFIPDRNDVYYYNKNVWNVDAGTGKALHYDGMKMTSGLVAYRSLLLEHYNNRLERIEKDGWTRRIGFEPGKKLPNGIDNYEYQYFESPCPNVNIKHNSNITKGRFNLEQYRCKEQIKDSWQITDSIPCWGKTAGRFLEFLREINA